ncbi:solute carrier family 23 member 1-like [Amphiura filiformis]|uniref:solute carrier family 23 member 1-like n=1 Tax=Amphiura filiformis TaxID=82378 RepID=UPI003B2101ED
MADTTENNGSAEYKKVPSIANDLDEDDEDTISLDISKNLKQVSAARQYASVLYSIDEVPPFQLTVLLGMQQFLTMFGGVVSMALLVAQNLCMEENPVAISRLLATSFFVYGLVTLLQTTFGVRLPIIQGGAFSFVVPIFAISNIRGECPKATGANETLTLETTTELFSAETMTISSPREYEIRMREIQGALMLASIVQVVVGFTGIMGYILRFIGPLSIAPITALIGLALFEAAAYESGLHWGIALLTIGLIILFSQYLSNVSIPYIGCSLKKFHKIKFPIFKLFPIILAIVTAWLISLILTVADVFPNDPNQYGYAARTDRNAHVLREAPWFAVPYPGQWGRPTVSVANVFGIMAGVFASMVESVGDYYACARLCGAPPPPQHAVNRGIGIEGIGCILCGAFGTSSGSTSFSENIGAIGITKVGSRVVVQAAGVTMVLLGLFTKFSAVFTTIPIPVVGGVMCCTFGMLTAVGISNLQFVNLRSSRNLFVLGFSTLMGLVVPHWIKRNPGAISTTIPELNQIITVLLSTGMFVGGVIAFSLDNTIPGTPEDRGLLVWRKQFEENKGERSTDDLDDEQNDQIPREANKPTFGSYDLPFISKYIFAWKWTKYLPFCPTYQEIKFKTNRCFVCRKNNHYDA